MSNHLSVSETLELLARLKETVRDFTARETQMNSALRVASGTETRAHDATAKQQSAALDERVAAAETTFQAAKAQHLTRHEQRSARIAKAHKTAGKQVLEQIEAYEGRRKYTIQKGVIEAGRRRETETASATAVCAEFKTRLAENRAGFEQLEADALKTFRGYGKFRRLLAPDRTWPEPDLAADEYTLLENLNALHAGTSDALARFRKRPLPLLFRLISVWMLAVVLILAGVAWVFLAQRIGVKPISMEQAGIGLGASLAVLFTIYFLGSSSAASAATSIASDLARARRLNNACLEKADARFWQESERIKGEFESTTRQLDQQWQETVREAEQQRATRPAAIEDQAARVSRRNRDRHEARLASLENEHAETLARLRHEAGAFQKKAADAHAEKMAHLTSAHEKRWQALQAEWSARLQPIYSAIQRANATAAELFPEWQMSAWEIWIPPAAFKNAAKFGRLDVDVVAFTETSLADSKLALPGPANFSLPLVLTFPRQGSVLFETKSLGGEEAVSALNNIIFRLLSTTPPGKLSFTIFDPVGLGQSFAGIMHLADYAESHINSRIWTQSNQIEERLAELNEHMEKVIQMYLRNEYATIAEYNAEAGTIAEKYHLLVVAGFPVNFSETAARRLINIAASGARCGVYTLIQWDHRQALPSDFVPDELRKNSVRVNAGRAGFGLGDDPMPGVKLTLDAPPESELATHLLHLVGEHSKDSNRVEVPFAQVAPAPADIWTEDATEELRVPIGRSGATKLQYLAIGRGTRQHGLIAGKTGSGKSTLFHVVITNLSMWCSPEQVEFYLVDFKKGVEFKCYGANRLPHARVVAIESDREFGLSVLHRVDSELRRRGDLFRKLGVQDLAGYKRAGGTESVPRSLLMIDEFQEFFVEEDRISQQSAVLLDRIVRQGRAFGIHVLLGSQTLGGAYTLARATIGQMVIRIALQCNEADAYLIMDENNAAPRLLSRPGEGIYNDMAGALEGNSPFQTVWLPDAVRDESLKQIREVADASAKPYPGPLVFEGNAPADVRENLELRALLRAPKLQTAAAPRAWLGAPNSIKGPTEAVFQKQSGHHLLMVGQREESMLAMLAVTLVSLAAQHPRGAARLILFESTAPGSPEREFLDRVIAAIPHPVERPKHSDLPEIMNGLAEELKTRPGDAPATFLLIHGLQNYKRLRQEDDFGFSSDAGANPAGQLVSLINEGASLGLHVIATCDTYNNVNRFLGRKTLSEFAMRVLFQMSAADSASLIDVPDAGTLGLHRALFYNDREGYLETFRPYALPGADWLAETAGELKRLLG